MSAIAGIVHLDGDQVPARDLEHVLGSMGEWGNGSAIVAADSAYIGSVGAAEDIPRACLGGSAFITVAARLYNREEVSDLLGVGAHPAIETTDEWLIVRAFERWGEACPERLNGDWSMAVWIPADRRLFLARDHFGISGLYYARCGERVAFASDIRALRTLPWLPRRLDETRIASLMLGGGVGDAHSTVYRDVARLPPAHSVAVTRGETRRVRYWRLEDTPDSGPSDSTERAELLRDTVRAAVSCRLGTASRVGSMLSGGLDSGAVTAFAAEHMAKQSGRLKAFTGVPAFPTRGATVGAGCVDEGPAAADVARAFDSIDHILVPAREVSPVAGIRRGLAIHGEPITVAPNYNWLTELLAVAQANGIKLLLTGSVGDFVMAGRPAVDSWRHDWSAGRYRQVVKRLTPNWVLRLRRVDWQPWRFAEAPWRTYSLVNNDFAAEIRLVERLCDAGRDPRNLKRRPGPAGIPRMATLDAGAIWAPLGATYGLAIHDPLQDKRVMEHMFSAPRPPMAVSTNRWLFRQSLAGVLPERIIRSRSKGMQSADIVERLMASWAEVEEALAIAEASPLARRCVDMRHCRFLADSIRKAPAAPRTRRHSYLVVDALSTALFLAETWEQPAPPRA